MSKFTTVSVITLLMMAALLPAMPALQSATGTVATEQKGTAPPAAAGTEAQLRERVVEFWQNRLKNKTDLCYALFTKEAKEQTPLLTYIRRNRLRLTEFEIKEIKFEGDDHTLAVATVGYSAKHMNFNIDRATAAQKWRFEDGNWYFCYKMNNPFSSESVEGSGVKTARKAVVPANLSPAERKRFEIAKKLWDQQRSAARDETGSQPDQIPPEGPVKREGEPEQPSAANSGQAELKETTPAAGKDTLKNDAGAASPANSGQKTVVESKQTVAKAENAGKEAKNNTLPADASVKPANPKKQDSGKNK